MDSCEDLLLSQSYWKQLCEKCVKEGSAYQAVIANLNQAFPHSNCESVMKTMGIDAHPGRLLAFVLWLKEKPDAYRKYRQLVLKYQDTWVKALCLLALQ